MEMYNIKHNVTTVAEEYLQRLFTIQVFAWVHSDVSLPVVL